MDKAKIKIFLADDHEIMRQGLRFMLEKEPNFQVIGEASCGESLLEQIPDNIPDIAVIDINMPKIDGIEAIRILSKKYPDVKTMVLTAHLQKPIVERALQVGANGFMHKDSTFEELTEAINAVWSGEQYLCTKIQKVIINRFVGHVKGDDTDDIVCLSEKEIEIVRQLCAGKTTKEIAFDMDVSPKTVDAHRRDIMAKLGMDSVAELVKFAIREGITAF